jgi:hypothetical protein
MARAAGCTVFFTASPLWKRRSKELLETAGNLNDAVSNVSQ